MTYPTQPTCRPSERPATRPCEPGGPSQPQKEFKRRPRRLGWCFFFFKARSPSSALPSTKNRLHQEVGTQILTSLEDLEGELVVFSISFRFQLVVSGDGKLALTARPPICSVYIYILFEVWVALVGLESCGLGGLRLWFRA